MCHVGKYIIYTIYINGYINIKLLKPPFLSFLLLFSNFYAILCQVKKLPANTIKGTMLPQRQLD